MPTKPDTTAPADSAVLMSITGLEIHFQLRGSSFSRLLGLDTLVSQSFGGLSILRRAAGATTFGPVEKVRSTVSGGNGTWQSATAPSSLLPVSARPPQSSV